MNSTDLEAQARLYVWSVLTLTTFLTSQRFDVIQIRDPDIFTLTCNFEVAYTCLNDLLKLADIPTGSHVSNLRLSCRNVVLVQGCH